MGITVHEALSIGLLRQARVLAGRKGLSRVVEHVDVIEMPDIKKWLRPNILFLTSFYALRDDPAAQLDLVRSLIDSGGAALAVDTKTFLKDGIPREILQLAETAGFPVIELPEEGGYIDVISPVLEAIVTRRSLKSNFLDDLLFGNFRSPDAIVTRAKYLGWQIGNKRVVMIVDIDDFEDFILRSGKHEQEVQAIKGALMDLVTAVVQKENPGDHIIVDKSDSIIVLPSFAAAAGPVEIDEYVRILAGKIQTRAAETLKDVSVSIGIGNVYFDPAELARSFREANLALSVGHRVFGPRRVFLYRDTGVYQLLWEIDTDEKVREFCYRHLKPILDYDRAHGAQLADTLEAFLDSGQDLTRAAARLFVHRSTVKYRLARVKQLLGTKEFSGDLTATLLLALKAWRYLEARSRLDGP